MGNVIELDIHNSISVVHFEVLTRQVTFGEDLRFTFTLQNVSGQDKKLDIRYEILHPDAEGHIITRLYRISTRKCPTGFLLYNRSHTIFPDSAHEPGIPIPCELRIVVNGKRLQCAAFEVLP